MKKFIASLIIAVCLLASGSYAQTADSFYYQKVSGTVGTFMFRFHDTGTHTVRYQIETNSNATFTGLPSFTGWDTITIHGNVLRTITVYNPDTNASWGRVRWDTLAGPMHMYVLGTLMLRQPSLSFTVTRATTHLYMTLTVDPGNDTGALTGTLGYNAGFTSTAPISSRTVTGLGVYTIYDTVPYTLAPGTPYWEKYVLTTRVNTITKVSADTTLVPLPIPTSSDSVITIGGTTYARRIKCNVYGISGGYAKSFVYDSATLALIDTQRVWLTATTGTQSPLFTHTGLTPVHAYIAKVNVHDTAGDVWLLDTFRTISLPVIPVTLDSFWYLKTMGYNGTFMFRFNDTAPVQVRYRVEVNDSAFTGVPHYSVWDTVIVSGHLTRSVAVSGGDTVVNWGRVLWNKIGSSTVDTTTPVIMLRQHALTVNVTPATTHLYPNLVFKPTNGRGVIVGTLGFDSSFTSFAPLHTFTITSHPASITIPDTVGYTLTPNTVYWIKYVVTDTFGSRTYIIRDTTLPLVTFPYIADDGPSTVTSTTGTRPIKLDIYGSSGSYLQFFVDSAGIRVDSQYLALPAIVGVQTFSLTTIHRAPVHTYVWNVKVHNSVGDSWITTDSFTTDPAPSVLSYHNDTVKQIGHSIHYVLGYTNYAGEMNDVIQMMQKVGSSTPVSVSTTSLWLPIGTVTTDFPITTPGTYKLWSYGHDYSTGGHIAYSDTTTVVVSDVVINYFTIAPATAHPGDTVTISYYASNSDSTTITNTNTGLTTTVSDSGVMKVVADTTTTYTLSGTGFTTKTANVLLTVTPVDSTDTTTNVVMLVKDVARVFPNPVRGPVHIRSEKLITNLKLLNMVGHCVICSHPMTKELEIDTDSLPEGKYFLTLWYEDQTVERINIVVQR